MEAYTGCMAATILVIDDHGMVRQVVEMMLTHYGYTVYTASDGERGLELYERHGADAAIVDVDMPGLTGPDVCRELTRRAQGRGRNLVLWLMTGVVRPELATDIALSGAVGVIAKPFSKKELLACFEQHGVHGQRVHAMAS